MQFTGSLAARLVEMAGSRGYRDFILSSPQDTARCGFPLRRAFVESTLPPIPGRRSHLTRAGVRLCDISRELSVACEPEKSVCPFEIEFCPSFAASQYVRGRHDRRPR